jgi:hypothetical protein
VSGIFELANSIAHLPTKMKVVNVRNGLGSSLWILHLLLEDIGIVEGPGKHDSFFRKSENYLNFVVQSWYRITQDEL